MAVDLSELVPSLKREVGTPGTEESTFPAANEDSWVGYLSDAFWSARLDGMLAGYTESDGLVDPDLDRDLQQLIVLYAGIAIVRNELLRMQTTFRAKSGPVEYEVQQAASVLKGLLDDMTARKALVMKRLSDLHAGTGTYYIDSLTERDRQINTYYWPR
jgi:hypothetical protein